MCERAWLWDWEVIVEGLVGWVGKRIYLQRHQHQQAILQCGLRVVARQCARVHIVFASAHSMVPCAELIIYTCHNWSACKLRAALWCHPMLLLPERPFNNGYTQTSNTHTPSVNSKRAMSK